MGRAAERLRLGGAALVAGAAKNDVVLREAVPLGARDALERAFERVVVELVDAPAAVAHEVVMVCAARLGRLEAGAPVPEIDPVNEPPIVVP